ncbi:bile acid:sodium symporter [Mycobacterium uberis]|uniref:bile acid:sodium symporter n=1 Tax=Mycobacterium uberis TaxID=2162698 RepID=UPI000E305DFE
MGVVKGIWVQIDSRLLVLVVAIKTALLAVILACTGVICQLAQLDRQDSIVLLFCGSNV